MKTPMATRILSPILACTLLVAGCSSDDSTALSAREQFEAAGTGAQPPKGVDPDTAESPVIDRFSEAAATLMVRTAENGLPAAGEPIDFDRAPFITSGLGPEGQAVRYYNFDVQPNEPAAIYAFFREGTNEPISGQLNVVDVIPGDARYSDFWQVHRVTVPADYVANQVTSLEAIMAAGYGVELTDTLVNCPIVPDGSVARLRAGDGDAGLVRGWYQGKVVHYFSFLEQDLSGSTVPIAPIYVTFNINPDQEGGGPASGFRTEDGSSQTHNVLAALPGSSDYSPLWAVSPYDNRDFANVSDLASAERANVLARGVALVNCPVVED